MWEKIYQFEQNVGKKFNIRFLKVVPVPNYFWEYQRLITLPKRWEGNFHSRSHSKISGMQFLFPFPFPRIRNAIFNSHSRYQNLGMG